MFFFFLFPQYSYFLFLPWLAITPFLAKICLLAYATRFERVIIIISITYVAVLRTVKEVLPLQRLRSAYCIDVARSKRERERERERERGGGGS